MLQISESTDIVGTVVNCLQLFPPCFQPTVETIKKELTQLPTQDFSWVPYVDLWHRKHWDNLRSFCTQWFRPNPLCCKKQQQSQSNKPWCSTNPDMVGLSDVSLCSVNQVNLQCQISLSEYNGQYTSLSELKYSGKDYQNLRAGLIFAPHGSSRNMLLVDRSSTMASFHRGEQGCERTDITLEQLKRSCCQRR